MTTKTIAKARNCAALANFEITELGPVEFALMTATDSSSGWSSSANGFDG